IHPVRGAKAPGERPLPPRGGLAAARPRRGAPPRRGRPARPPGEEGKSELVYRPDVGIAAGRYAIGQMLPGWGMGDDQRLDQRLAGGRALVYPGDPLDRGPAVGLIGAPVARLWLSSTREVAFVSVKLCDVAPDGTSALVTKGLLNLTHRDSHERPEPLVPGR